MSETLKVGHFNLICCLYYQACSQNLHLIMMASRSL